MPILIFTSTIICIVLRCFIFHQRNITWWKGLIPVYNKYIFGKLCNQKRLGYASAISIFAWWCTLIGVMCYEIHIMTDFGSMIDPTSGRIYVQVPDSVKTNMQFLKYFVICVTLIALVMWTWTMTKFSKMHDKPMYWAILWAVLPVIPLCSIAFSDTIYMNNTKYTVKRVIDDGRSRKSKPISRISRIR